MTFRVFAITLLMLCTIFAQKALAHEEDYIEGEAGPTTKIHFKVDSSTKFNPLYDLIWESLTPLYKGTKRDKNNANPEIPIIGNTEIDLNGDKTPEIIAYHVESEQEKGTFCNPDGRCPFFVFDTSTTPFKPIGKIYTRWLDLGDSIKNGYWTLKTFDNGLSQEATQTYSFDPKLGMYAASQEASE